MRNEKVRILLVEDDEVDVECVTRAFGKARILNSITVASNGVEALEHLRGENGRAKIERPYLVLLDINMPKMNGLEFLAELRNDEELKDSVVFILTTSDHDKDRREAHQLNAAGYIQKDQAGEDFLGLVEFIRQYWMLVKMPGDRVIMAESRDDPIDLRMKQMREVVYGSGAD